jgi:hypothetical protein
MLSSRPARSNRSAINLEKRSHRYGFRIRVPTNVRHRFCTDELKYSLQTDSLQDAKRRYDFIIGKVVQQFQYVELYRSGFVPKLSPDKLRKIVRDYVTKGWIPISRLCLQGLWRTFGKTGSTPGRPGQRLNTNRFGSTSWKPSALKPKSTRSTMIGSLADTMQTLLS